MKPSVELLEELKEQHDKRSVSVLEESGGTGTLIQESEGSESEGSESENQANQGDRHFDTR